MTITDTNTVEFTAEDRARLVACEAMLTQILGVVQSIGEQAGPLVASLQTNPMVKSLLGI